MTPRGIPDDFVEHTKLMFDLMTIAFQADITRISTFMMAREVSYRTFPMLGISEAFHPASHHQNNAGAAGAADQDPDLSTSASGRYLLEKLRATPDGDGNLLDHSLLLYGGAMSNSNVHNHSPLPIVVAGGAAGRHEGRTSSQVPGKHADGEPAADDAGEGRHSAGQRRRQHRAAVGGLG